MSESLWEVIGPGDLTSEEEDYLERILHATLSHNAVTANAFIVDEEQNLIEVITVFSLERRNAIVGHVYEPPNRVVVAQFKDWLAPNIDEGGVVDVETWAAKAEEIQDDEAAAYYDSLIAAYDNAAE